MDNEADQPPSGGEPSGGETWPYEGAPQPAEAWQPPGSGEQPAAGQPPGGGPQPYGGQQPPFGQQPYPGPPQSYPGQPYPGQPYPGQTWPGQQPYGGPPYRGRPKVRPGRVWYLAPLAVFLGGVAAIVIGIISVNSQVNSFARAPLPAGGVVTLNHTGGYVVYYEAAGASAGTVPSFNVQIHSASPSARFGNLKPYVGSLTYQFGSHDGVAVATLQVGQPGRFLIRQTGAPAVVGGSDLAFGSSIAGSIVVAVLLGIGLLLIGVAGAVTLLIIRIVRVRRARASAM